ncbi:BNR-4 repeat-containing protein [Marinactinospora thermotolerans]|uniref:F5/8 type C domain-containing protein n=1 Tax=Marinactinospora thermotolerans DSM 45154 TaxID=1122192 RepID=A0A1T4K309_9ACTN|nr:BNR-4 repeat-containing protein [Marinactinospora thermotolerans]SJZ36814.1 F5/8 type C domain-containing protein [Marinactinospora thermotolerans DSM 45154]
MPSKPRTLIASATAVAVALPLSLLPAAPALAADTEEVLPYAVDDSNQAAWWTPLDSFGGSDYFAFNAPASAAGRHEVHIAERAASGAWSSDCLRAEAGGPCVTYPDDLGHNQPSIVVDGTGRIHAFVSMHNDAWRYYRSRTPGDIGSMTEAAADLPDADGAYTYPVTARDDTTGDVYVLVRAADDAGGRRMGRLYHWDDDTAVWAREATVGSATGHSFYPDDLAVDGEGRLHVLWEWGPFPADPFRHVGSYLVYDPATGRAEDAAGAPVSLPASPSSGGAVVYQPYTEGEDISTAAPSLQSAKLALDEEGRLAGIAYRFRVAEPATGAPGFDVRHARWTGSGWEREIVAAAGVSGVQTSAAVDVTTARGLTRVYFVAEWASCTGAGSRVVRAERTGEGPWRFDAVGTERPRSQRLAARTTSTGADLLYVSAPYARPSSGTVSRLALPRPAASPGASWADLAAELTGEPATGGNIALGGRVSVSSSRDAATGGELAVDGDCSDASRWISAEGDTRPTITVDPGRVAEVSRVRVASGYTPDPASTVLKDFSVRGRLPGGSWVTLATIADNTEQARVVEVPATEVDRIQLVITDPSRSEVDVARVRELEIYE